MLRRAACLIAIAAALTAASPLLDRAKVGAQVAGSSESASVDPGAMVAFSIGDRQSISNFFLRHDGYLAELPPGQRRQLVTKGRLPPGIARKALPASLSRALAALPPGFSRLIVGPDVLLVQVDSGLIVDIIRDVVR